MPPQPPSTSPLPPAKTVLVIENDHDVRSSLVQVLEDEGYTVMSAENGKDGLEILRQIDPLPQVIILDLMMPVMDGRQFREEQARDPRLSGVPVVVLSADGSPTDRLAPAGAAAVLKKPIPLEQLLAVVAGFCA